MSLPYFNLHKKCTLFFVSGQCKKSQGKWCEPWLHRVAVRSCQKNSEQDQAHNKPETSPKTIIISVDGNTAKTCSLSTKQEHSVDRALGYQTQSRALLLHYVNHRSFWSVYTDVCCLVAIHTANNTCSPTVSGNAMNDLNLNSVPFSSAGLLTEILWNNVANPFLPPVKYLYVHYWCFLCCVLQFSP